jgi:hypothetical protein
VHGPEACISLISFGIFYGRECINFNAVGALYLMDFLKFQKYKEKAACNIEDLNNVYKRQGYNIDEL